jgi:hypothetical protein
MRNRALVWTVWMAAAFVERARQETDLEVLTADLVEAVQETMQPDGVNLWMRPTAMQYKELQ